MERVSTIFHAALDRDPAERDDFLIEACGSDRDLLDEVRALLDAHGGADSFFEKSAWSGMVRSAVRAAARPLDSGSDPGLPFERLGEFRLIRMLGKGGMGTVYEAEQTSLKRRVALKVLPAHLGFSDMAVRKFQREAEAGGRQSHPGIVAVHAVGKQGRVNFIAQELVEGGVTLADHLGLFRETDIQPKGYFRDAAGLAAAVADALDHAHASGVIHRDIKPSNILLDAEGRPKVTDFGLAKVEDALSLSRTGDFAGTPYYMSPEQAMSRRRGIDRRTDIYSLGVTLYETLTLKLPFEGDTSQEVLKKILLFDPVDPRKANPRVPRDLAVICLKAMEKQPGKRYQAMADFADDLRRFLSGDVIRAQPPGLGSRSWKRVRRYPVLSASLAVALVAAVGFVGYILLVSYPQILQERRIALAERNEKEKQLVISEGLRLAAQSLSVPDTNPTLALLLAIEAAKRHPGLLANNALMNGLEKCRELNTLSHDLSVGAAYFSPDGRQVVTACEDRKGRVWDAATGALILLLDGHESYVQSAVFSPDGRTILTASADRTLRIWSAATGRELRRLAGHEGVVFDARYSPGGRRIVSASEDRTARIWDVETGKQTALFDGHDGKVLKASFSPDGRKIITASKDRTARIWDVDSGEELLTFEAEVGWISDAAFSPDGRRAVLTYDNSAHLIDVETGDELHSFGDGRGAVVCADFSPDGRELATANLGNNIVVWDAISGERIVALEGHEDFAFTLCFSPDGQRLLTASMDRTARIWTIRGAGEVVSIESKGAQLWNAFPSADLRWVIATESGNPPSVRETATGEELLSLGDGGDLIYSAAFSPDGSLAAVAGMTTLSVFETGSWTRSFTLERLPDGAKLIAFSPDGTKVVVWGAGAAIVVDALSGEEIVSLEGHRSQIISAEFSPDSTRVVTGANDGTARIWEIPGGLQSFLLNVEKTAVFDACFSPDGQLVVTAGDESARIWDAGTGKEIRKLCGHTGWILDVDVSSDGRRVVTASSDRTAGVWDVSTGEKLLTLKGHEGDVCRCSFSPDGSRIATGSWDHTVRIWNSGTGEEIVTLTGLDGMIRVMTFSSRGDKVFASSAHGTARIWTIADPLSAAIARKPRDLTPEERTKFRIGINRD